jgi:hypothetical protein
VICIEDTAPRNSSAGICGLSYLSVCWFGRIPVKAFAVMMMMNVRTLNQELCTRTFAFYLLTKDATTSTCTLWCAWAPAVCSSYKSGQNCVRDCCC